ncbi:RHS Repeat protein [Caballeronia udeis]|uniref:RHS Repeat protein n=2 Tax=Caballeronia udeis TaxID=1232866 RepID=A0A158GT38_9BURK|nr:RHS Repeat protein [Caballeronia udeis]
MSMSRGSEKVWQGKELNAGRCRLRRAGIRQVAGFVVSIASLSFAAAAFSASDVTYTYDALGRLTKATYNDGLKSKTIDYYYDAAGNRSIVKSSMTT